MAYASEEHRKQDLAFLRGRATEGRELAAFLDEMYPGAPLRILDIGSGDGAVAAEIANRKGSFVVALEYALRPESHVAGDGMRLPFREEQFDVVLCLETLEHVPRPRELAAEIMRVLKPDGICVLTTPARLRFLLRRDPHFAVPGLLLLPDAMQKWLVTRVLRRLPAGEYDVSHIYAYAGSIVRLFPGRRSIQAIGAPPKGPFAKRLWSLAQRFLWQRLIIRKLA